MLRVVAMSIVFAALTGCGGDRMSERGFSLPEGNAIAGQEAFTYLHCYECHSVDGVMMPSPPAADSPGVVLGGKVSRVKTYGQLVTAIINPSHKLAPGYPLDQIAEDGTSRMPVYNGHMTVQELVDIVAFLQPHYEVAVPRMHYPVYP